MTLYAPDAAFFLMPFRIYEFAIGAAIALLPALTQISNSKKEILTLVGFALVGYSVLQFDASTPFPDTYALVPCIGAACLILAGDARFSGRILVNPISLYLGQISYSLYLVHWPIIVIYKHVRFVTIVSERVGVVLLILSLISAHLLFRYVENRFRYTNKRQPSSTSRWVWLAVPILVCVASVHAFTGDGWSHRYDAKAIQAIGNLADRHHERNIYKEHESKFAYKAFDADSETKLLIIGDSLATDLFNALYSTNPDPDNLSLRLAYLGEHCYYLFDADGTSDKEPSVQHLCEESFNAFLDNPLVDQANWIIISTRWDRPSLPYMIPLIKALQQRNNKVIVSGRTAEFKNVPALVYNQGLVDDIEQRLAGSRVTWIDGLNEEVERNSKSGGAYYLDKLDFLCDITHQRCDVVDADGKILYTDYGHWTIEGARYFGERFWVDGPFLQWFEGDDLQ